MEQNAIEHIYDSLVGNGCQRSQGFLQHPGLDGAGLQQEPFQGAQRARIF